ncbi:hypothetical protein C7S16_5096 [Burkholderia thailandensis]|uniref:Uncharacterized protein n=1 Tax=Burkholderia thailandensis TaxID=57975 RepID=A0AAW9CVL7_BURTH|nr:hypothetical protein [Burkholderia thailandensis]
MATPCDAISVAPQAVLSPSVAIGLSPNVMFSSRFTLTIG